ncbi:DUF6809 family protein [Bacillus velezensis]
MKTILQAMYHGQIRPDETAPSHAEYRDLSRQILEQTEQWRKRLGEETFRELEEFFDLYDSENSMNTEAAFFMGSGLEPN